MPVALVVYFVVFVSVMAILFYRSHQRQRQQKIERDRRAAERAAELKQERSAFAIPITGLDKAAVLAVLYNASCPRNMGFLDYDPTPMTVEEARQVIGTGDDLSKEFGTTFWKSINGGKTFIGHLKGRAMKVDLTDEDIDPRDYDSYNGSGAAARAIAALRATNDVNPPEVQRTHKEGTRAALGAIANKATGGK